MKKRNGKIDLMKFVFSVIVVFYHFACATKYTYPLFVKGYLAVEFFFIVTGYLFASSVSKLTYSRDTIAKDSINFMKKKIIPIIPYHIFTCLGAFIVFICMHYWDGELITKKILHSIPDLLFVQMTGLHDSTLLTYEWYISAMLLVMTLLTPIAIRYRKVFFTYVTPVLAVFLFGYMYRTLRNLNTITYWNGFFYSGMLRAFLGIFIGIVCYRLNETGFLKKCSRPLLLIVEFCCYFVTLIYANGSIWSVSDFAMVMLFTVAITISFSENAYLSFMDNPVISFLGKLSLPIYLTQMYMIPIFANIPWPFDYNTHVLLYVCSEIAASLICLLIIEGIKKLVSVLKNKPKKTASA